MLHSIDCAGPHGGSWQLHDVVHLSCHLADSAGFAAFPGRRVTPYAELMEAIPVRARSLFYGDEQRLAFDVGNKVHAIESN